MKPILLITLLLSCSVFSAARAQDSAADLIRQGMSSRGVYSGYTVKENARPMHRPQDEEAWDGLEVSEAFAYADEEATWSYVVVVQNHTDIDYCIRPRLNGMPKGQLYYAQDVNQIVKSGQSLTIFTAADEARIGTFRPVEEIAFWRPDYTGDNGAYCRAVAPVGLNDWLAQSPSESVIDFEGSRR
ncbi:MAG: hypothetical protein GC145_18050 [Caulobacter sp.]|nr:hypothetical protein [Caulobacter sp.]